MLVGRTGPRPACAHLSEVSGVSGGSLSAPGCPARPSQSAHDCFSSACRQAGTCFLCRRYLPGRPSRLWSPGAPARRPSCTFLVPSTVTVPAHHPSKYVSRHGPGPHGRASLTSFQPPACCPWTVTSRKAYLTPVSQPHQALTLQGSAAVHGSLSVGPNHESPWWMAH